MSTVRWALASAATVTVPSAPARSKTAVVPDAMPSCSTRSVASSPISTPTGVAGEGQRDVGVDVLHAVGAPVGHHAGAVGGGRDGLERRERLVRHDRDRAVPRRLAVGVLVLGEVLRPAATTSAGRAPAARRSRARRRAAAATGRSSGCQTSPGAAAAASGTSPTRAPPVRRPGSASRRPGRSASPRAPPSVANVHGCIRAALNRSTTHRAGRRSVRPVAARHCSAARASAPLTATPCSWSSLHMLQASGVGTRSSPSWVKKEISSVTPGHCWGIDLRRCRVVGACFASSARSAFVPATTCVLVVRRELGGVDALHQAVGLDEAGDQDAGLLGADTRRAASAPGDVDRLQLRAGRAHRVERRVEAAVEPQVADVVRRAALARRGERAARRVRGAVRPPATAAPTRRLTEAAVRSSHGLHGDAGMSDGVGRGAAPGRSRRTSSRRAERPAASDGGQDGARIRPGSSRAPATAAPGSHSVSRAPPPGASSARDRAGVPLGDLAHDREPEARSRTSRATPASGRSGRRRAAGRPRRCRGPGRRR